MNRRHVLAFTLLMGAGAAGAEAQVIFDGNGRVDPRRSASSVCSDRNRDRERDRRFERDDDRDTDDRDTDDRDSDRRRSSRARDFDRGNDCSPTEVRVREQCVDAVRDYSRQRTELQQRLRRQHADWHRTHQFTDRNYVRQHNQLHERLERAETQWERAHGARVRQCERVLHGKTADYDHDYDRHHRTDRAREQRRS